MLLLPAMWCGRAGRGAVSSVQLYLVTSGSSVMKRSSAVIATVTTSHQHMYSAGGLQQILRASLCEDLCLVMVQQ